MDFISLIFNGYFKFTKLLPHANAVILLQVNLALLCQDKTFHEHTCHVLSRLLSVIHTLTVVVECALTCGHSYTQVLPESLDLHFVD